MLKHHLAICGHSWMVDGGVSCQVTRLNHPPENSGSPYFSMNAACQLQADAYRRPTFSPRIGTPRTLRCWPWACTMAPSWSTTCARGRRSPSIRAPSEPTSTRIQCGRLHCHALDPTGPDNECWLMVIIINSDIMMIYGDIPFGNDQQFANLKVVIEIVDLPIKVVTFHSYVRFPEPFEMPWCSGKTGKFLGEFLRT